VQLIFKLLFSIGLLYFLKLVLQTLTAKYLTLRSPHL